MGPILRLPARNISELRLRQGTYKTQPITTPTGSNGRPSRSLLPSLVTVQASSHISPCSSYELVRRSYLLQGLPEGRRQPASRSLSSVED